MLWIVVGLLVLFVLLFAAEVLETIHEVQMERRLRSALRGRSTQQGWNSYTKPSAVVRKQYRKHGR